MSAKASLLWFACALAAAAADFASLQPKGYVNDFARVVAASEAAELERYAAAVEKATGVQMAFVTLPRLEGEPIEDVANLLYRRWGIGQKGKDEGVLILLAIAERRSRVEVGYGLEPVLTDGSAGSLLREMRPALRGGGYGAALSIAAHSIGERVAKAKNVKIAAEAPPSAARRSRDSGFPWEVPALIVVAGLVFLANSRRRRRRGGLPAMFYGAGPFTHSGGGFGGYDSGDSFGGFGGGDSGGGGASSDW
jgi:uncharacterized protein